MKKKNIDFKTSIKPFLERMSSDWFLGTLFLIFKGMPSIVLIPLSGMLSYALTILIAGSSIASIIFLFSLLAECFSKKSKYTVRELVFGKNWTAFDSLAVYTIVAIIFFA